MGLHATIDFGCPTETPILGIPVDYSDALDEFCDVFEEYATSIVPVDTGYLRSTISSTNDGECIAECFADAEYAQYVEYGTWKMAAQPYFEPAIAVAWDSAEPIFQEIWEDALEEENEELTEMLNDDFEAEGGDVAGGGGFLGGILSMVFIGIVKGIFSAFREAVDTTSYGNKFSFRGSYHQSMGDRGNYDIEIT